MASDCAHHQCEPAAPWIEQPAKAVVLRSVFELRRQPALDVFDLHQPQLAQDAVADELARVTRHRISRVTVRDGEKSLRFARAHDEIAGLREVVGDGLVAYDVEPGVERSNGI